MHKSGLTVGHVNNLNVPGNISFDVRTGLSGYNCLFASAGGLPAERVTTIERAGQEAELHTSVDN